MAETRLALKATFVSRRINNIQNDNNAENNQKNLKSVIDVAILIRALQEYQAENVYLLSSLTLWYLIKRGLE